MWIKYSRSAAPCCPKTLATSPMRMARKKVPQRTMNRPYLGRWRVGRVGWVGLGGGGLAGENDGGWAHDDGGDVVAVERSESDVGCGWGFQRGQQGGRAPRSPPPAHHHPPSPLAPPAITTGTTGTPHPPHIPCLVWIVDLSGAADGRDGPDHAEGVPEVNVWGCTEPCNNDGEKVADEDEDEDEDEDDVKAG